MNRRGYNSMKVLAPAGILVVLAFLLWVGKADPGSLDSKAGGGGSGTVTGVKGQEGITVNGVDNTYATTTATVTPTYNTTATDVSGSASSAGTHNSASRGNHTHRGVSSAVAGSGIGVSGAYGDVTFSASYGTTVSALGTDYIPGQNTNAARGDHVHPGPGIGLDGFETIGTTVTFAQGTGITIGDTITGGKHKITITNASPGTTFSGDVRSATNGVLSNANVADAIGLGIHNATQTQGATITAIPNGGLAILATNPLALGLADGSRRITFTQYSTYTRIPITIECQSPAETFGPAFIGPNHTDCSTLFVASTDAAATDKGGNISLGLISSSSATLYGGVAGRRDASGTGYLQIAQGASLTEHSRFDAQGFRTTGAAFAAGGAGVDLKPVAISHGGAHTVWTGLAYTGPTVTSTHLSAGEEVTDVDVNIGRTVTIATGALANQRFVRIRQPTLAFDGASTATYADTLCIDGAPVAGTNATITTPRALHVVGGLTDLGGALSVTNNVTANALAGNNLTSGRIATVGTSGKIQDDANLAWDSSASGLTVTGNTTVSGSAVSSPVLRVRKTNAASGDMFRFDDANDGTSYVSIQDGAGAAAFIPDIMAIYNGSDWSSLTYYHECSAGNDTGVQPLARIVGRRTGQAAIQVRPILGIENNTTRIATFDLTGLTMAAGYGISSPFITTTNNVTVGTVLSLTPQASDYAGASNGQCWDNSSQKTIKHKTATGVAALTGVVYANTADSTAIANTVTETIFDTKWTTPANWGAAGKALRIRAFGKYSCTGTPTLQFGVRYGSTTLAGPSATMTCQNNGSSLPWTVDATILLQGTGATAAYRARLEAGITGATDLAVRARGSGTLDETTASAVGITAVWGAAAPSNTITCEGITVEVLN